MARPVWNGVVSFGMVSIPVKLFTATDSKDLSFHQLHRQCNSRLRQMRWCPACQREVEWAEVARGYEYAKEQYVVLADEDLEALPLPSKRTIEVSAFVQAEQIDPVFYERSYYLEPEEVGARPFALLMRALKERGLVGIGKVAVRNKERLCALRPTEGSLVLETLFFPDEIRVPKGMPAPQVLVSERELSMANSLIDLLLEPFQPEKYSDQYRAALMEVIEAKLQGQEVVEAPAAPPAKVIDLMEALKASVEAARKRRAGEATGGLGDKGRRAAAG